MFEQLLATAPGGETLAETLWQGLALTRRAQGDFPAAQAVLDRAAEEFPELPPLIRMEQGWLA